MILISPRILNSAQKQRLLSRSSFDSDGSDGRVKVNIINDVEMSDDYLYDALESKKMNPRTIGRSGSFVDGELDDNGKTNNASFQLSTAPTIKEKSSIPSFKSAKKLKFDLREEELDEIQPTSMFLEHSVP
jgi:hypothetical protein